MNNTDHFLHYASPYYDPVKAHEYYMKNRELKGRRSTTKLSDKGKEVWSYTKNEIKNEKTDKVKSEQERRKQKITELRANASATRKQISVRLKELNAALSEKASRKKESVDSSKASDLEEITKEAASEKEKIEANKNAEIKRLMAEKIPEGLSKEERAKRVAEKNEKIAKLRTNAKADKTEISEYSQSVKADVRESAKFKKQRVTEDTKKERADNSANASTERKQVASELKSAISVAREAYKAAKESLDSSYEEIFQREFDKIAAAYAKKSKRKSRKKK